MFFWLFNIFEIIFFQRSPIRKKSWRPNSISPHPGRGTLGYHKVPYGTIWYHMVPYGTIRYPKVPRPGWGETLFGRGKFFGFLTSEKKGHIFISKNHKNLQNSSNIKEFWPFDVWKRIPMKFLSFWSKNHWKRTILSRVIILFGFAMVPYGTIRYLMVPYF